jgi:hypothetical protein
MLDSRCEDIPIFDFFHLESGKRHSHIDVQIALIYGFC